MPPQPLVVVDNRMFLIGLDHLYRFAMKRHERDELLPCARRVAAALQVSPAAVPVEGYYSEDRWLTEYFLLMRALQDVPEKRSVEVASLPAFDRLIAVTSSVIFGRGTHDGGLLPTGYDALTGALERTAPDWTVEGLTAAARAAAVASDECSLVGLAARAGDALVLTAVRESVVLYAMRFLGGVEDLSTPRYDWQVDPALAEAATRLVVAFNTLFEERLPRPQPENAAAFASASSEATLVGRCVHLGSLGPGLPRYHWAICRDAGSQPMVHEFWHADLWTTARYRAALPVGDRCPDIRAN